MNLADIHHTLDIGGPKYFAAVRQLVEEASKGQLHYERVQDAAGFSRSRILMRQSVNLDAKIWFLKCRLGMYAAAAGELAWLNRRIVF
ncbi:MAG: hypothetical protein JWQ04_2774 [Pedosphaera sp.]|nr:hypothetical protein [Pedosphaera sp.]